MTVLGILTVIVYEVSLSLHFAWDDIFQILDNPLVRSWSNVPKAFMSDLWVHVHSGQQLYYRPLFTTWSILNYSLFQLNPWGWHLAAILLHVFTVCVFFAFARKLDTPYWTAAAAATLFALHPIHIETVSWISAASDTMVALFYMAAFISFINSRNPAEPKRTLWLWLSLGFLACGLLTKEMAVSFCLIVAFYVWIFPKTSDSTSRLRQAAFGAAPYVLATVLYLVLRKLALHSVIAPPGEYHTVVEFVLTLPYVLAFYLWKFLVPVGLTGLYYTPYLSTPVSVQFMVSVAAVAGFALAIWYWQKKKNDPMVAFLGVSTLITLLPVLYLPNFRNGDFVRDRYAYIPSICMVLLAAKAIALLPSIGKMSAKSIQIAMVSLLCLAYVMGASQQAYWDTDLTIFKRGYELYPNNHYAKVGYARVIQRIPGEENHAIELLRGAIQESPDGRDEYFLLAQAYSRVGDRAAGLAIVNKALALTRNPVLGDVEKADLAGLYGRLGDYDTALNMCQALVAKSPDLLSSLYNCGNVSFGAGRYPEAEARLQHAVELDPGEADPLFWLGRVHFAMGAFDKAKNDFARANIMREGVHDYHYWLGMTLEKQGDSAGARGQYQETLRLDPHDEATKQRLAALP